MRGHLFTRQAPDGLILAGAVEVPVGTYQSEHFYPMLLEEHHHLGPMMVMAPENGRQVEAPAGGMSHGGLLLGDLPTSSMWRKPQFPGAGEMFFRRCPLPGESGMERFLVVSALSFPDAASRPEMPGETWFEVKSQGPVVRLESTGIEVERGQTIDQVVADRPWPHAGEDYFVQSTLALEVLEKIEAYREALFATRDLARADRLRQDPDVASMVGHQDRDPDFMAFTEFRFLHPDRIPATRAVTAQQREQQEALVSEAHWAMEEAKNAGAPNRRMAP